MIEWIRKRDWLIRTLKTFVATFGGVLVPELCIVLSNGFPESMDAFWLVISPFVASALSAAITAAWNILLERLNRDA